MASKLLDLAQGLSFPAAELACEVSASLGNRGGGKTNGSVLVVEQMLDAGIPAIVLDYVGIWFGLRLQPDGKNPSRYEVPVIGGRHGDIALQAGSGAVVADALASRHSSAVLDMSLLSKADRCRFATDFAESFFRAKKKHPGPVLLVLEEAQRFVPQNMWRGQERMLGAFEEIAEVGRNFGIGLMLISQRPQKLNKDVLNLADTVFAYRTIGAHERRALAEWVKEKGATDRADVADELPMLPTGMAVVWCPSRRVYGRFQIKKKSTYDAGATPLVARTAVETQLLDLAVLEAAMGEAAKEAKASDPREIKFELRKCIEDLKEADAARKKWEARAVDLQGELDRARKISVSEVKLDVVPKKMVAVLERAVAELRSAWSALGKTMTALDECAHTSRALSPEKTGRDGKSPCHSEEKQHRAEEPRRSVISRSSDLSVGEMRVLIAVAQHDEGLEREQLTVLTGYRRSSRDTFLQRLRAAGLVGRRGSAYIVTEEGLERLGPDFTPLPTGQKLYEYWRDRLSRGELAVLDVARGAHPDGVSKEKISEDTPYRRSSRDTFLQKLRARGLVEVQGSMVRAADVLFE